MGPRMKLNTKWIATVASIWIQCSCGASYTFGIYSSILKSTQGYDQSTLDTVSVFKDIGANVGVLSGFLYSAVTLNRRAGFFGGPWVVHLVGAIQCFAGYFLIWASVVGLIHKPPLALMCLFMLVAAHAQTFFNTANVVSGVKNFGNYGGTIVGIMKGFLGLSGAILIQLYDALCKGHQSTFILILALTPTLVSLLLMHLVKIYGTNTVYNKKHLNGFSAIALTVAAYLMIIIILENIFSLPLWARIIIFLVLLLLLFSPLETAIKAEREDSERLSHAAFIESSLLIDNTEPTPSARFSTAREPIEYHGQPSDARQMKAAYDDDWQQNVKDMNLWQAMCTVNFWLLFVAMICGMGTGLATINNISQIGESLGYNSIERTTLVSLWSIWNFLGRFGGGYVSDVFLHTKGWARPLFIAITLGIMTLGHIVIALGFPGNLYVGSILVGVCYGSQWSLMPTITSEIFGVGHMGTIFNTIAISSPVGSYIFSVRVMGYLYDKVATGEDNSCYGTRCFMLSFFIMASVATLGCLVALLLFFRTKKFYEQVVLRRLQDCN
ncbi:Nodulin-like domain-containing protein/MFS_1 domain-containing protein [Cephalotus follicularis]|uniref:Nodulin-like domain-containing protein/MFS_1 domain-containing protein n=1 Tax=Cephalotus follicularis TaxID=3775 RepID=A0A1Q3BFF5_CEPFO|nr:Nodulin-like domain-containing protein/MFS_1 domain-containing protein [Cephalotus follicularis]